MTLTKKVVNKGKAMEGSLGESIWTNLRDMKAEPYRREEDLERLRVKGLATEVSQVADRMRQLTSESEQVREENERLRGQLKRQRIMAD